MRQHKSFFSIILENFFLKSLFIDSSIKREICSLQWRREGVKAEGGYFPKWEKILEIASNLQNLSISI